MKPRDGIYYSDFYLSNGKRIRKSLGTREKTRAKDLEKALMIRLEAELKGMSPSPSEMSSKPLSRAAAASSGVSMGVTLKEAFKRARREHEKWRASKSPETIEGNFKFVAEHFGELKPLHEITDEDVFAYAEKLRDAGKSPSTINQRLSLLSVLFKCARRWPDCKGIVKKPEIVRQTIRNGRIRVLSYAEEAKVLKWFRDNREKRGKYLDMEALTPFLLDTGFRLSEALNLASAEIQWEARLVPAWDTKADHPRMVPMTARVRGILEARRHLEYPFGMFSVDSADDCWEAMRKGIGINTALDPEFVIHALRHTCASRLAAEGMDAFRIQKWMGHKNITTTMKYVTLFAPDLKGLADALDEARLAATKRSLQKEPEDAAVVVPSVPNGVPRRSVVDASKGRRRVPQVPDSRRRRPGHRTENPVGVGLLIRRSLVRAQVGEPSSLKATSAVDTNTDAGCTQECDQKKG